MVHPHNGKSPLELFCSRPKTNDRAIKHFYAEDYVNPAGQRIAFHRSAMERNALGFNCYTALNQIRPDWVARAGRRTDTSAIEKRKKILVDLDRKNNKKRPAHDDEITTMEELADRIVSYLQEQGWPVPHKVLSGNGYHIYYPIDLPVNDESEVLVKQTLVTLAAKFNTDEFEIDTVVFDAPRITKVIGTVARKGEATLDRPHRLVELIK
jgi:hypothetical protein